MSFNGLTASCFASGRASTFIYTVPGIHFLPERIKGHVPEMTINTVLSLVTRNTVQQCYAFSHKGKINYDLFYISQAIFHWLHTRKIGAVSSSGTSRESLYMNDQEEIGVVQALDG